MPFTVLHVDDRLLVVNKPSGLLSQPGRGPDKADCLERRAAAQFPGARIVHRLDRDTSGLMVLARDADAHRNLSMQFERRHVAKRYIAIVAGAMTDDVGEVNLPLRLDLDDKPRQIVDHAQGKSATTKWRAIERLVGPAHSAPSPFQGEGRGEGEIRDRGVSCASPRNGVSREPTPSPGLSPTRGRGDEQSDAPVPKPDRTRVELEPVTGRSHQLRVHMQQIGHPILGDNLYAPPDVLAMADRLLLHATMLSFVHPGSGQRVVYEAGCPF